MKWSLMDRNGKDLEREIVYVSVSERDNNSYTLNIHNGGALKLSTVVDLVQWRSPPIGSRFSIYICRTHLSQRINLWRRQAI